MLLGSRAKRMKMFDFNPRQKDKKVFNPHTFKKQLQDLTTNVPNTCIRLMWDIHPIPPDFENEIEVACQPNLEQQVQSMIYKVGQTPDEKLIGPLTSELVEFIEELTCQQDKCKLWHDLHIGRLTSSNFGQIFHTKNSPSLLQSILYKK